MTRWNIHLVKKNEKIFVSRGLFSPPQSIMSTATTVPTVYYKTQMCKYFLEGKCNKGEKCNFAHGEQELKKIPCKFGFKCRNESCTFFHDDLPVVTKLIPPSLKMFVQHAFECSGKFDINDDTDFPSIKCDPKVEKIEKEVEPKIEKVEIEPKINYNQLIKKQETQPQPQTPNIHKIKVTYIHGDPQEYMFMESDNCRLNDLLVKMDLDPEDVCARQGKSVWLGNPYLKNLGPEIEIVSRDTIYGYLPSTKKGLNPGNSRSNSRSNSRNTSRETSPIISF